MLYEVITSMMSTSSISAIDLYPPNAQKHSVLMNMAWSPKGIRVIRERRVAPFSMRNNFV